MPFNQGVGTVDYRPAEKGVNAENAQDGCGYQRQHLGVLGVGEEGGNPYQGEGHKQHIAEGYAKGNEHAFFKAVFYAVLNKQKKAGADGKDEHKSEQESVKKCRHKRNWPTRRKALFSYNKGQS